MFYENIYSIITNYSKIQANKTLLAVDNEKMSYGDFEVQVEKISNSLIELNVTQNTKVALIIPNSIHWYIIYWAIVKIGAIPVPLDPQVGEWEMERLLMLTKAEVCFIAYHYKNNNICKNILNIKNNLSSLKNIILCNEEINQKGILSFNDFLNISKETNSFINIPQKNDTLMLACTSGSTGNPKIIVVPHIGFHKAQYDMAEYLKFNSTDKMLLGMPLYHQGGFGMGLQMVIKGGTVNYQTSFLPEKFLEIIEKEKITVIQLTATLAKIILSVKNFSEYDFSSVRLIYFAGEVLPKEIAQFFYEKLNIRVVNVIGSSETATMLVWDSNFDTEVDVNDFRPLSFTKMMILDENKNKVENDEIGTIYIHTDALLSEYLQNETETNLRIHFINGIKWFDTGDLGVRKLDGRVRFAGRSKRIIKRGANLIYPEEIEAFLLTHPDIEAVAVVGEKHELIGEMLVAHIQPRKNTSLTRGDLVNFSKGKLAAFKIPDQTILNENIPNDIGKIQFKYL